MPDQLNQIVSSGIADIQPIPNADTLLPGQAPKGTAPIPTTRPFNPKELSPMQNNDQLYSELQSAVKQRKEMVDKYNQLIGEAEPKLKKIYEDQIVSHQQNIDALSKLLFPEAPVPKPPEVKDVQQQLGVVGSIATGLLALTGFLARGTHPGLNFANSYSGMVEAFQQMNYDNFMKASKTYEQQLQALHLETQQALGKYQDQFNKMVRGMAEADEIAKLKTESIEKPLSMHLQALQMEEKALEAQEKLSDFYSKELFKAELRNAFGGEKGKTDYQSVRDALREELKREPKEAEIRAKMQKEKVEVVEKGAYAGTMGRGKAEEEISPPFAKWTQEEKEFMFKRAALGFTPRFAFGDRKSYTQFYKELGDYESGKGVSGTEFETGVGEAHALKSSLQVQEKSYGMMTAFVNNINAQINRLKEISKDVERFDARLLNVPLVEWRSRVVGTPYENKINMYVTEISTEIGKVTSGSQASVRELNVQTREKWEKIHDLHLSIPKMIDVMEETSHAANIRKQGASDAINETQKRLKGVAEPVKEGNQPPNIEDLRKKYNY